MPLLVSYTSLEPSFTQFFSQSGQSLGFDTSQAVSLFASTSFLYSLGIMLSVVAAGIMYMRAGAIRMQASEQAVRKSNAEIKRVTIGLLGVLSLFVIIYTFNRDLLTGDVGLEKLKTNQVVPAPSTQTGTTPTTQTTSPAPFIPANNDDPKGWDAIKNDAAVRSQLAGLPNGGITVNKRVCTTPTQTGCTTVGGLPSDVISMLTELRNACGGQIEITGGSEAGHKSHGPGKPAVDLSMNKPGGLNECIRAFPAGESKSFCYRTHQKYGFTFCDEISSVRHWHVYK